MKKILLSIILVATFYSCKVQLVPTYNAPIVNDAVDARVYCDSMYNAMILSPPANYKDYINLYNLENVKISNLVFSESIRPHSKILLQQVQRIQNNFKIFQNDHATNIVLKPAILAGYKAIMDDLFRIYISSQNNLN